MAVTFEWPSDKAGGAIKAIFHNPDLGTLTLQCHSEEDALSILPELQQFDPRCRQLEGVIIMSRGTNARGLVGCLLEQELVGQGCMDEMVKDYDDHRRESDGFGQRL
jgi:hypothetical protein